MALLSILRIIPIVCNPTYRSSAIPSLHARVAALPKNFLKQLIKTPRGKPRGVFSVIISPARETLADGDQRGANARSPLETPREKSRGKPRGIPRIIVNGVDFIERCQSLLSVKKYSPRIAVFR